MVIFGLLLLLLAVVAIIAAVARGSDPASIDLVWFTVKTNVTGMFVAGALTTLIAVIGLALLMAGLRRDRRRRAQITDLKQRAAGGDSRAAREQAVTRQSSAPPLTATPGSPSSSAAGSARSTGSGSSTDSTSTRPSGSTSAGSSPASQGIRRGDGPDEHFDSAPRES